jgi:hypothetical protein
MTKRGSFKKGCPAATRTTPVSATPMRSDEYEDAVPLRVRLPAGFPNPRMPPHFNSSRSVAIYALECGFRDPSA